MSKNSGSSSGIGFCGMLTIVFVVLKLVGVIDWKWVWVLCPLWISAALVVIGIAIYIAYLIWDDKRDTYNYISKRKKNDKWKF